MIVSTLTAPSAVVAIANAVTAFIMPALVVIGPAHEWMGEFILVLLL